MARVAQARLFTQALAALVTVVLFHRSVPAGLMAGWLGALAGSLTYTTKSDWSLANADERAMTTLEFYRQALGTAVNALVWVVPMFAFAPRAMVHLRFELWTVLAMLMTVSAVIIPTVPLATLLFSVIVGAASVVVFLSQHQLGMAGVTALFVASIALGTIEASRHFLHSRLASAGIAESSEVVRLLLREFEDDDSNWLWLIDSSRRVRSVSRRFAEALGMAPEAIEGQGFLGLLAGQRQRGEPLDPSLNALAERLRLHESFFNLLVRVLVKGEPRWWEMAATPRIDENGVFIGFRGVAADVTDERESSERIAYLARYDTLTGLPNRRMVLDALAEALAGAGAGPQSALLMLDLDRFKPVNDTLGHPVGDALLAAVAERLMRLMDRESMLCGRLGGDEFAVVVRGASDSVRLERLANEIIASLSSPYQIETHTISIGCSIGTAMAGVGERGVARGAESVEEWMRHADFALYRAKQGGRGRHCAFDENLQDETRLRRSMEGELRQAISRGELELTFQPEVEADSGECARFEALLRWHSPAHGTLSPAGFLTLAEESRLILPIGEWVLGEACRQAAAWPGKLPVSVNISARQLLDPSFADTVVQALATSGLAPQRLCLEVQEAVFERDAALARSVLERARALGCMLVLEDFGAGPSALTLLCELAFCAVKLDRALIKGAAAGNIEALALIRAGVAMAETLEIAVTAKGVETQAEHALAKRLGCRRIQGTLSGRAMPGGQVPAAIEVVRGFAGLAG